MNEQPKSYLERAEENLAVAKLLLEQGYPNVSVSRAYYSMFYLAQAMLLKQGLVFSKHSAVIAAFGREFAKSGMVPPEFHRYLIDGQDLRLFADYRGTPITVEEAEEQIDHASQFLNYAKQYLSRR